MLSYIVALLVVWYVGSLAVGTFCPCARADFILRDVDLPKDMRAEVGRIEKLSKDKAEFVEKSYDFLSARFKGYWFPFFLNPPSLMWKNLLHMWNYKGVLTCLNMNYIGAQFLIHSKFFSAKDISDNWKFLRGFSYHKYLVVDVDGEKVVYDLWRGKLK